jgi:cytidyltransferase-like protein
MDIVRRARAMKDACVAARAQGQIVGFVPTMGALHDGHIALVRRVKAQADLTVVSIFVNPTQFGPGEDFARYPRDLSKDADMLAREGGRHRVRSRSGGNVPAGAATFVEVAGLSDKLEGKSRPGHFRGVATIVTKLFAIVEPPHRRVRAERTRSRRSSSSTSSATCCLDVEISFTRPSATTTVSRCPAGTSTSRPSSGGGAGHPAGARGGARRLAPGRPPAGSSLAARAGTDRAEPSFASTTRAGRCRHPGPSRRGQGRMLVVTAVFAGDDPASRQLPLQV